MAVVGGRQYWVAIDYRVSGLPEIKVMYNLRYEVYVTILDHGGGSPKHAAP